MQFIQDNLLGLLLLGSGGAGFFFKDQLFTIFNKLRDRNAAPLNNNGNCIMSDLEILINMRERYKDEKIYKDLTNVINGIINPPVTSETIVDKK